MAAAETMFGFLGPLCHALLGEGHEVVAASHLDFGGQVVSSHLGPQVEVHPVRAARRLDLAAVTSDVAHLAAYLRHQRFDVLHVHGPLVALQARLAARLAGVPIVVNQAHGFYFHEGSRPLARWGMRVVEQQLTRHLTDVLVTVNDEDADLARRHRFRPRAEQIVAVPGVGVDVERFAPDATAAGRLARHRLREELGATPDDVVVTFVGRLVGEKGLDDLAAAFGAIAAERRVVLWLVGGVLDTERDRNAPARIAGLLAERGFGHRVHFLGRRDDVPGILRASDVFVLPSHREGLPVSLLEAMACGLPVVTTDIRGCREVVTHGISGLLVPAHDPAALAAALAHLHDEPARRATLAAAARARVLERYTVAASLAPLLALYRELERHRGAPATVRVPRAVA